MLVKHKQLAMEVGMADENVFIAENGSVIELNDQRGAITRQSNSRTGAD